MSTSDLSDRSTLEEFNLRETFAGLNNRQTFSGPDNRPTEVKDKESADLNNPLRAISLESFQQQKPSASTKTIFFNGLSQKIDHLRTLFRASSIFTGWRFPTVSFAFFKSSSTNSSSSAPKTKITSTVKQADTRQRSRTLSLSNFFRSRRQQAKPVRVGPFAGDDDPYEEMLEKTRPSEISRAGSSRDENAKSQDLTLEDDPKFLYFYKTVTGNASTPNKVEEVHNREEDSEFFDCSTGTSL